MQTLLTLVHPLHEDQHHVSSHLHIAPKLRGPVGMGAGVLQNNKKKSNPSIALVFLCLLAGCWDLGVPLSPSSARPVLAPVLCQALYTAATIWVIWVSL